MTYITKLPSDLPFLVSQKDQRTILDEYSSFKNYPKHQVSKWHLKFVNKILMYKPIEWPKLLDYLVTQAIFIPAKGIS